MLKREETKRLSISVRSDGSLVVTDLWADLGLNAIGARVSPKLEQHSVSALHPIGIVDYGILLGEEPPIHGESREGCGAIYVHGCAVRCSTCYQPEFFSREAKFYTNTESLSQLMLDFQAAQVHSILFVIDGYKENIHSAIKMAKRNGLRLPVVYKYSGLLSIEHLNLLQNDVDIFVPDVKAISDELAAIHGLPKNYRKICLDGVRELIRSGKQVIIRHLLIPHFGFIREELSKLFHEIPMTSSNVSLSLLTQYQDPRNGAITSVGRDVISFAKDLAGMFGCKLYIQTARGWE